MRLRFVYQGRDYDRRVVRTPDVEFWVEECRAAKGRVLELGCGTGRVTIPVAEAGVDMVGLDNSESMLRRARWKAVEVGVEVEWMVGDMRSFELGERFGLVYVPLATFGHMATEADALACLGRVMEHLMSGGRFAIDLFNADSKSEELETGDGSQLGLKVHTAGEVDELLEQAGMLRVARYGNYDRSEYAESSQRLIVVAELK